MRVSRKRHLNNEMFTGKNGKRVRKATREKEGTEGRKEESREERKEEEREKEICEGRKKCNNGLHFVIFSALQYSGAV